MELNDYFTYTVRYDNNSNNEKELVYFYDLLPSNGDSRKSRFSGRIELDSFSADLTKKEGDTEAFKADVTIYGSTTPYSELKDWVDGFNGKDKATIDEMLETGKNKDGKQLFVELGTIDQTTGTFRPSGSGTDDVIRNITGIYVKAEHLGSNRVLSLVMKLRANGNEAGDVYKNTAFCWESGAKGDSSTMSTVQVETMAVSRDISGQVWYDRNADGRRESGEALLSGVTATLFRKEEGGTYKKCTKDVTGEEIKSVVTDDEGSYSFGKLPAGEYIVAFSGDSLKEYTGASPYQKEGVSASVNSDSVAITDLGLTDTERGEIAPTAYAYAVKYDLKAAGMNMHTLDQMVSENVPLENFRERYKNQDLGLVKTGSLKLKKTVAPDVNGIIDTEETFTFKVALSLADPETGEDIPLTGQYGAHTFDEHGETTVQLKHGEEAVIDGLPVDAKFTVTETEHETYVNITEAKDAGANNNGAPADSIRYEESSKRYTGTIVQNTELVCSFTNKLGEVDSVPTGAASFAGRKQVINGQMKAFSFEVYAEDAYPGGAPLTTVRNDSTSGAIHVALPNKKDSSGNDLGYVFDMTDMTVERNGVKVYPTKVIDGETTIAKEFVYYVKEVPPTGSGSAEVGYESKGEVYRVTVTIALQKIAAGSSTTGSGNGMHLVQIPAETKIERQDDSAAGGWKDVTEDGGMVFTNVYKAKGGFTLSANKKLLHRNTPVQEDEFTFEAYELKSDGTLSESPVAVAKTAEGASAEAGAEVHFTEFEDDFFEITENTVDCDSVLCEHAYIVKEKDESAVSGKGGIRYSGQIYKVVVTVADGGNGSLNVTVPKIYDITPADGQPVDYKAEGTSVQSMAFTNDWLAEGKAVLELDKTLTGGRKDAIQEGEFSFTAVKLAVPKGAAEDEPTTYTELSGEENEYTGRVGASGSAGQTGGGQSSAEAAQTGGEQAAGGTESGSTGAAGQAEEIAWDGTHHASASIEIPYTQDDLSEDGTAVFWYKLTEDPVTSPKVDRDPAVFYTKVEVMSVDAPLSEGETKHALTTEVTYYDGEGRQLPNVAGTTQQQRPSWTNSYHATGGVNLEAKKKLIGGAIGEGDFMFEAVLKGTKEEWLSLQSSGTAAQEAHANKNAGTPEAHANENAGTPEADPPQSANASKERAFGSTSEGKLSDNVGEASVTFAALRFDETDIGRTYVYEISEVNEGKTHIAYSDAVFYATVTVSDSQEAGGDLTFEVAYYSDAALTADVEKPEFTNTVLYELPSSGGPGTLWHTFAGVAMMLTALLLIRRRKGLLSGEN